MKIRRSFGLLLFCLFALTPLVYAQGPYLFGLQSGSFAGTMTVYQAEAATFIAAANVPQPSGTFLVVPRPDGSAYYLMIRNSVGAVVSLSSAFITQRNFGVLNSSPSVAVITPDGRRLVLGAGNAVYVFDLTQSPEALVGTVSTGDNVLDVGASIDSSRAFAVTSTGQLTAIDMTTFAPVTKQLAGGNVTGMTVGPDGYLYVSAANSIFQVDGRGNLAFGPLGQITVQATPGKLVISSDGHFALGVNPGPAGLVEVDLTTGAATVLATPNQNLNKLYPAGPNRVFATSSADGNLYEVKLSPLGVSQTSLNVPLYSTLFNNVVAVALSSELPSSRYLYMYATVDGQVLLHRIDLQNGTLVGRLPIIGTGGPLSFFAAASQNQPASVQQFNNNQTIGVNAASAPLVVRVLDSSGLPVFNAGVTFIGIGGASVASQTVRTNYAGFATTTVSASAVGSYSATASVSGLPTVTFNFQAVTNPGTGGTGGGPTPATGLVAVGGNGQLLTENQAAIEPLTVQALDPSGKPIPNLPVAFSIAQGGGAIDALSVTTDSNGLASVNYFASSVAFGQPFQQTTVTAASTAGTVNFYETSYPRGLPGGGVGNPPLVVQLTPDRETQTIAGNAGQTIPDAFSFQVSTQGLPVSGVPIPNVGLRLLDGSNPSNNPPAGCVGFIPLSDQNGVVKCDLIPKVAGTFNLQVVIGDLSSFNFTLVVAPGLPTTIQKVQGDNQSAKPNTSLGTPLKAIVKDGSGNPLVNTQVAWTVIPQGGATLINPVTVTDSTGAVTTAVKLGSTAGNVQIRVSAGSASATFTETVVVIVGGITVVSGDAQTALVGQAFAQPLVVVAKDTQNNPLAGASVTFTVTSGTGAITGSPATTDASGRATVTVTAGNTAGALVITASAGGSSTPATFNLIIRPPGPTINAQSFQNAASFRVGLTPCGLATIIGAGLAPGVQGVVQANSVVGPLLYNLAGVDVTVAGIAAPIFSVVNLNGKEQVTIQVPCEVTPGIVSVVVHVSGSTTQVDGVTVSAYQPGIFEFVPANGLRYAVAVRQRDGSYITPDNPAHPGDVVLVFLTGLNQTTPATATNRSGVPGQAVLAQLIGGINNAGATIVGTQYAEGMVGVYIVQIQIPTGTATGNAQPLAVAVVGSDGSVTFANPSLIPIAP